MSCRKARETTDASTDDNITGEKVFMVKSPKITSRAKITPAMGALNTADMPAAAPHPTSILTRSPDSLNIWPMVDPTAAPICTMGPSRPAEPPDPMQMADATALATATRGLITPDFNATAAMTSGTP